MIIVRKYIWKVYGGYGGFDFYLFSFSLSITILKGQFDTPYKTERVVGVVGVVGFLYAGVFTKKKLNAGK